MAEARQMADLGYTDIQLLGQNVNAYHDPLGKKTFAELLYDIGEIRGIRRVRFTTSHPRHFSKDIVDAIAASPRLCDHIHLPVQSGSSKVLKAMNREYTREMYLEKLAWIRSAKREISLTTDVIVGFPGETNSDFEETITLLHECQFDAVFAFKYSPRPNTPSLNMIDSTPDDEKSKRLQILMDRQREIQRASYQKHVGRTYEAMVEGRNEARGQIMGRTSQNITLNFTALENPALTAGSYVNVLVTRSFPNSLLGEMV
jgi:tRNA-2-methylthio-N6-dimethylallyladenosine synthase